MSNWKRTKDELPKNGDSVIYKLYELPFIDIAVFSEGCFWEDTGICDEIIPTSDIEAWCKVPKYDLEDDRE